MAVMYAGIQTVVLKIICTHKQAPTTAQIFQVFVYFLPFSFRYSIRMAKQNVNENDLVEHEIYLMNSIFSYEKCVVAFFFVSFTQFILFSLSFHVSLSVCLCPAFITPRLLIVLIWECTVHVYVFRFEYLHQFFINIYHFPSDIIHTYVRCAYGFNFWGC